MLKCKACDKSKNNRDELCYECLEVVFSLTRDIEDLYKEDNNEMPDFVNYDE